MKKTFIGVMLLCVAAGAAHARLSLADRMILRHQVAEQQGTLNAKGPHKAAPKANPNHITTALVKLAPGATAADLEAEGMHVAAVRGDIAMVSMPTSDVERLGALKCVRRMELSRNRSVRMSEARMSAGVSKVHGGIELDHPYTGDGVLVGIVDQGMDPNHINFRNEDGTTRLGLLTHVFADASSKDGWTGNYYVGEEVKDFTTDEVSTFHGTHTMGILAGGYRGPLKAAVAKNLTLADVKDLDSNPYYGVACGAEIAAGCGDLNDMFIALNIDQILSYREYTGKPGVVSLSLGSNIGSHSPKALMNTFLEECGKEAIFVVSAGNEGDIPLAITKNLTADDNVVQSFVVPTYQNNLRYGQVYFYSPEEFSMQAVVFNRKRERVSYRMPVKPEQEAGEAQYYCSADQVAYDNDIVSSQFENAFSTGYVGVGWDNDEYTGEYMCLLDYYTVNNELTNAAGDYILGFIVEGKPGQRIECYCDGNFTALSNYNVKGWDDGSFDGTISDMACGYGTLVVGSYNTRDEYPALDGFMYGYQGIFQPGQITPFSSWGNLADGRSLPHVCAPGAVVISSSSSYYTEDDANRVGNNAINAQLDELDRSNYWCPAMGTSMSTPLVAGSIALWLEADPTLTLEDVKDIIAATAVKDNEVLAGIPAQWGAGKFDAYAGLKEVMRRSMGIESATAADNSPLMVSRNGETVEFFLAGANSIEVKLYTLQGAEAGAWKAGADQLSVDLSSFAPGVYVAVVNGIHNHKLIK